MANVLKIGVENPEELLNAGAYGTGALIQVQTATSFGGAYADVTGTGSTPTIAIVSGTYSYTGYDPAGASTSWYRTRYKNAAGTILSDWSAEFQVSGGGYCSLYDVKQDLDKAPTDATADELLLDYITEATDFIDGITDRSFAPDPTTIYTFDGYSAIGGGRRLLIPWGVQSISLFEVAAYTGASFGSVPTSDLLLRPLAQDRTSGWPATEVQLIDIPTGSWYYFPPGFANVRLTGVFGFASVPARIEGVARRLVVRAYSARQAGQNDLIGTGGDGGSPMVSQYLSRRDREILESFRLVGM